MRPDNQAKIEEIRNVMALIRPIVMMIGIKNFPTVDELIRMAEDRTPDEDQQLQFIQGYLKGVGLACGNIGNINRASVKPQATVHQYPRKRSWLGRLFSL